MRRDRDDVAVRVHPELDARRRLLLGLDELLDDPAHPREPVEVVLGRLPGAPETRAAAAPLAAPAGSCGLGVAEERVALAGEAVVELHDGPRGSRPPPAQLDERLLDVVGRVQVLEAHRQGDAGLAEDLPAPGFRAEVGEERVAAVQRDAEEDRQLALEGRRVEDREVRLDGSWMPARIRSMRRGRSRIFSVSERGEAS